MAKEHRWLPWLAPSLPVPVPGPLGKGTPAEGYPWQWSVYRWLDGETPAVGRLAAPHALAADLAEFITALHRIDPRTGRRPTAANPWRPGTRRPAPRWRSCPASSTPTRRSPPGETALQAPAWPGPAVWIHADLQPGNLLTVRGRLAAVIDFGCLGLGDPAVDLIVAWYLLPADTRDVFRKALGTDDATWARGRGWALSIALSELRYYRDTNPVMAAIARQVIEEVRTEHAQAAV